jgi:hypothetical protein
LDSLGSALTEDLFAPVGTEGFLKHRSLSSNLLGLSAFESTAFNSAA